MNDTIVGTAKYVDSKVAGLKEYWNDFEGNPIQKVEGILADQAGIAAKQITHSKFFIGITVAGVVGLLIMLGTCYCNYNRSRPQWFQKRYDEMCDAFERRPSQQAEIRELREMKAIYQQELRNFAKNANSSGNKEDGLPLYPDLTSQAQTQAQPPKQ